jgi:hypothetical protein
VASSSTSRSATCHPSIPGSIIEQHHIGLLGTGDLESRFPIGRLDTSIFSASRLTRQSSLIGARRR